MASYLRLLAPYTALSAILFGLGVVLGLVALRFDPAAAYGVMRGVEDFIGAARGLSRLEIFLFIVANNGFKVLVMMILGVVVGLAPVFFLISNGVVVAVVGATYAQMEGAAVVIASLLPHGVVELAAVFVGAAAGLHLGTLMVQRIRGRPVAFLPWLGAAWRLFVRLLLPMVIVAAAIETWVTPALAEMVRQAAG